jgi:thioredoxin reductase (NADPH)
MAKPVLLTVDDDHMVGEAITRDLRRRYAKEFSIVAADSGSAALHVLRRLRLRGDRPAVLLADHRMPGMTGVEFLTRSIEFFPQARRVLLTAYADTDAAIAAINEADLHHYLLKPWAPVEQRLYPIIDELLDDWRASDRPPFDGVRVVGHRWSRRSHEVRDLLTRNGVPFQWLDVSADDAATELLELSGATTADLPVVVLANGETLRDPSAVELLGSQGISTRAELPSYDLVIVGAGPAGLAAAVYGASEGLRTLMVEREAPGGQAGQSAHIANYLGFPRGISGAELSRRALDQARAFGVEVLRGQQVAALEPRGAAHGLVLTDGTEIAANAVILAMGVSYRRLQAVGAAELTGAGVYYGAATTEAEGCAGDDVYLIGGANSAGQAAVHFAERARSVTLLVRGPGLAETMSHYLIEQLDALPNVSVRVRTQVVETLGTEHLEGLVLRTEDGEQETVATNWLFVFIGASPRTEWLGEAVERDQHGFVLTGSAALDRGRWPLEREPLPLETSVPGVFAAGDVRSDSMKRVAAAVGEGGMAVHLIHRYLTSTT